MTDQIATDPEMRAQLAAAVNALGKSETELQKQRKRAEQAEDFLRIAHETSNQSEAERAAAAIARVRALHVPRDNGTCAARCYSDGMAPERWPCPTIRVLDGTTQA